MEPNEAGKQTRLNEQTMCTIWAYLETRLKRDKKVSKRCQEVSKDKNAWIDKRTRLKTQDWEMNHVKIMMNKKKPLE